MLNAELGEMQSNMESARDENKLLKEEIIDKNALISRQGLSIESDSSEIKNLREQLRVGIRLRFFPVLVCLLSH